MQILANWGKGGNLSGSNFYDPKILFKLGSRLSPHVKNGFYTVGDRCENDVKMM